MSPLVRPFVLHELFIPSERRGHHPAVLASAPMHVPIHDPAANVVIEDFRDRPPALPPRRKRNWSDIPVNAPKQQRAASQIQSVRELKLLSQQKASEAPPQQKEQRDRRIENLMRELCVAPRPNHDAGAVALAGVPTKPTRVVYVKRRYAPVADNATMLCSTRSAAIPSMAAILRAGLVQAW
mmetsp:Transcript_51014/g.101481  ORF Transcript_51014/g.101481 Transcript_51014/m.101481 type:complete len:182 (-) Transcript_51014:580-1125(-)|eukprot:CAMPEP_0174737998 /NCGR_PEP_ID=MMETSP1094-20130205/69196_1 /TAXON_ID=156173 /ORGANISM="Chrysochromulina brevifilum, Strain UTEX LB 985" /LENGTH=181 /DNA_ID=CAMNT_0015941327 /DNA_START=47 /DNA_END=592 /DNA_ORIENTATION=+